MKRNRFFLYAISFFQGMVFYSSVATLYRRQAGLTIGEIMLIESLFLAAALLLELPWGMAADRIGYRRTIIFCGLLYALSKIIFWRARTFAGFLAERLLLAVVVSGLSGVSESMLYLSSPEGRSQTVFGIYEGMKTAGLLAATVIYAGFIGDNYRMAGLLTVISYGIAAVLGLGLIEVGTGGRNRSEAKSLSEMLHTFRDALGSRSFLLLAVSFAVFREVGQIVTVFFNQLQYVRAGLSVSAISLIYMFMILSGLTGVLSAPIAKRLKPLPMGILLFAVCGFSCMVLAVTASPALSVAGVFLVHICVSLMIPLKNRMENEAVTADNRATVLSAAALIEDLTAIALDWLMGKIAGVCLGAALFLLGALSAVGLVLYVRSQKN